jgi:outer membrane protein assembly factor BamA
MRVGMPLNHSLLQRAVRHFMQQKQEAETAVRAYGEMAVKNGRKGVRIIFKVDAVQHIDRVTFSHAEGMDAATLNRAVNLPRGAELWPESVDHSARAVANLYAREGYLETEVEWQATPQPAGVAVEFSVHRSAPTTLVRLEFPGENGLPLEQLQGAFDIKPGDLLSMDAIEEGIVQLKALYRQKRYYRADVGLPVVKVGFNRAVVEIPIKAGPRFRLQVRGNRAFDDATLLQRINYTGDEVLDAAAERDLAERVKQLYVSAGYPKVKVDVRETNAPPQRLGSVRPDIQAATDVPIGPTPLVGFEPDVPVAPIHPDVVVTFLIREGPVIRVVERDFVGDLLPDVTLSDLQSRLDAALDQAVPSELSAGLDQDMLRAARLGGSPGEHAMGHPSVQPHEVFSQSAYRAACDEIEHVYKSKGYLDATVETIDSPDNLEIISPGLGRAVITIHAGLKSVVAAVQVEGVNNPDMLEDVQKAVTVHVGEALSYQKIEDTRKAILALYLNKGYLGVQVDDEETPRTNDPTHDLVVFRINEGVPVRVSGLDIKGANHTPLSLIRNSVVMKPPQQVGDRIVPGDLVTPNNEAKSVQNLVALGPFTSAQVYVPSTTAPDQHLQVTVEEKPSYTVDTGIGISIVDGPRIAGQFSAAHFLGSPDTFNANIKLNVPFFRFCSYEVIYCSPLQASEQARPDLPVEGRLSIGLALPVFGVPGVPPLDQHLDVIVENLLRPAYFLKKISLLGTMNGLPHADLGAREVTREDGATEQKAIVKLSTLLQVEAEADHFDRTSENAELLETLADQKAVLLPAGPTQLVSVRPTFSLDARDSSLNPTRGVQAALALDFSHYFNLPDLHLGACPIFHAANCGTKVALISGLVTVSGYIPVYPTRRVIIVIAGRVGDIFSEPWASVIGTKTFFLGGTSSLRGFAEDGVIPEDVREQYDRGIRQCNMFVTGVACNAQSLSLLRNPQGVINSGGSFVVAGRADLRFEIFKSLDGDLFFDVGNLWSNPSLVNLAHLREAVGFGVAIPLPIGPATVDLGFNLDPDQNVGESLTQVHFAIGY